MDVYALFTDTTAEKIIIDSFPKKEGEKGLIIRTTICSQNLKESAVSSVKNAFIILEKHIKNLPKDITVCIYGFSGKVLGSSADLAFALSFVAHLLEYNIIYTNGPVPKKVGATGMIDERLNIRSVKGIKEKILAAIENQSEIIYFPEENLKDFEEIRQADNEFSKLVKNIITVPVKSLEDVFMHLGILQTVSGDTVQNGFPKKKVAISVISLVILLSAGSYLMLDKFNQDKDMKAAAPLTIPTKTVVSINYENVSPKATPPDEAKVSISPTEMAVATATPLTTQTPAPSTTSSITSQHIAIDTIKPSPTPEKTQAISIPASANHIGNSTANLINSGFTSIQSPWIFFTNNLDVGFYKMKLDGSEKSMITNHFATYINVLGSDAYYINKKNNSLYKIKTDGSDLRRLNDDDFEMIGVVGNWIYYICLNDSKIYKVDRNGMDRTPLCNNFTEFIGTSDTKFACRDLNITDKQIYFYVAFHQDTSKDGIYKMDTDGSNKTCISNDKCRMLTVDDGYLYYISPADGNLYKIDTEGSSKKKVVNDSITAYNIDSGWVYYSNSKGLYKINSDGDFSIKLNNDMTGKLNVVGEWIYYFNSNDGNRMYKVKTNGKERQPVE